MPFGLHLKQAMIYMHVVQIQIVIVVIKVLIKLVVQILLREIH